MNLLETKVKHITYGVGTVIEQNEKGIVVQFPTKAAKFQFPYSFERFLTAVNDEVQQEISGMIKAEREQKQIEEAAARAKADQVKIEQESKRSKAIRTTIVPSYSTNIVDMEWITPCNPNYFDVSGAYQKFDSICWKQSTNVSIGDLVYIYVSQPVQAVSFKCRVERINLPEIDIDDREFVIDGTAYERHGRYMELRLLKKLSGDEYSLKALQENGLHGTVQGPMHLPLELKTYLDSLL